jgi:hypothetical protein
VNHHGMEAPSPEPEIDIQFIDCETGKVLGHCVPFWPPSRAAYVHKVNGEWVAILADAKGTA